MAPAGAAGGTTGADISFPQCGRALPATPAFGIVGVNDGRPFTLNPCLVRETAWASGSGVVEFYMNTANPGASGNAAFGYGAAEARDAYQAATSRVAAGPGHQWWLDVETANSWSPDTAANSQVIAGALGYLRDRGVTAGIYSTRYQWGVITGGAQFPTTPNWVPGADDAADAPSFCSPSRSFSGGAVVMAQYTAGIDYDYLCPVASPPPPPVPAPTLFTQLAQALQNLLRGLRGR